MPQDTSRGRAKLQRGGERQPRGRKASSSHSSSRSGSASVSYSSYSTSGSSTSGSRSRSSSSRSHSSYSSYTRSYIHNIPSRVHTTIPCGFYVYTCTCTCIHGCLYTIRACCICTCRCLVVFGRQTSQCTCRKYENTFF